jgi:hypothetical protein
VIIQQATTLLVWGIVIHLICDWIFQNDYLARNKASYVPYPSKPKHEGDGPLLLIPHPAAWIHAGIHLFGLLFIFPWYAALVIAFIHLLIDTRIPLQWWQKFYKQTTDGMIGMHVSIWTDQVFHIVVVAVAALIVGR